MTIIRSALFSLPCLAALAAPAAAGPYCPAMLDKSQLEGRYQRLAPIYNSRETGWIFASDQFGHRYELTETEYMLMAQIVQEFAARGARLAVVIPPPRPAVAGEAAVQKTSGGASEHDLAAQAAGFHAVIRQLRKAGAVAPDLLELALSEEQIRDSYYFRRDTHWTNAGAAHSALALAQALSPDIPPAYDAGRLPAAGPVEERGSLSEIVRKVCGTSPPPEQSQLYDFSAFADASAGLLGTVSADRSGAVLLGTSFSNRYRRDLYQSAEAMSAALGRDVLNHSVSGGGLTGPMEAYILTGQLDANRPDLVIWEFPYTYTLREPALRQLLGALRADPGARFTGTLPLAKGKSGYSTDYQVPGGLSGATVLGFRPGSPRVRDVTLHVTYSGGGSKRLHVRRTKRMDDVALLDTWWVDLGSLAGKQVTAIRFDIKSDEPLTAVELALQLAKGV
ncbi:alginate O-acetyltransferase AlgX-related protein (plasmid) [Roseobacteraceae bacterium NS-SX3]